MSLRVACIPIDWKTPQDPKGMKRWAIEVNDFRMGTVERVDRQHFWVIMDNQFIFNTRDGNKSRRASFKTLKEIRERLSGDETLNHMVDW